MENKFEKIFEYAGKQHRYQFFVLTLTFLIWFCFEILSVSLSFLEVMPFVEYKANDTLVQSKLNYDICEQHKFKEVNRSHASWVSEFGAECNKVGTGLIGTFSFFGVLIGALVFQIISDKYGRKKSVLIASLGYIICIIAFLYARSIYDLWALSIALQFFCSIGNLSSFLLMNEVISSDYRSTFGAIVQSSFSISGIIFIAMFYFLDSWRKPFIMCCLLCGILCLIYCRVCDESPKYYLKHNEIEEYFLSLRRIASFNGLQKSFDKNVWSSYRLVFKDPQNPEREKFIKKEKEKEIGDQAEIISLLEEVRTEYIRKTEASKMSNPNQNNFLSLISYSSQRKNFLIMCYVWFCTSGVYYGLTLNIKNLPGNTYVTGVVMFIFESFAYILSGYIINITLFGRRNSITILYLITFFIYLSIILQKLEGSILISLSLTARFCVSGVYNIIYTYSTEIYPTAVRSTGLGMNSVSGRLGGMFFPLALEILQDKMSHIILAVIMICLILVPLLPETIGKPLIDSIPEEMTKSDQKASTSSITINTTCTEETQL